MKGDKYFDKFGCEVSPDRWFELKAQPEYCLCREYEDERVKASIVWDGRVSEFDFKNVLSAYWKTFTLNVQNYRGHDGVGKWVSDPVSDGKTFNTLDHANSYLNVFLTSNTDSHWNRDKFVEPSNKLIPPPPPDPDLPVSTHIEGFTDDFGAW